MCLIFSAFSAKASVGLVRTSWAWGLLLLNHHHVLGTIAGLASCSEGWLLEMFPQGCSTVSDVCPSFVFSQRKKLKNKSVLLFYQDAA